MRRLSKELRQQVFENSIEFLHNEKGYNNPLWNFSFPNLSFYHVPCFLCQKTINPFCFLIVKRESVTETDPSPPTPKSTLFNFFRNALQLRHTQEGYALICKKDCSKKATIQEKNGRNKMTVMKKMSNMACKSIWTQYSTVNLIYLLIHSCMIQSSERLTPSKVQTYLLPSLFYGTKGFTLLWFLIFLLSSFSNNFRVNAFGWTCALILVAIILFEVERVVLALYVSRFYVRCTFCSSFIHPFHFVVGHNNPWSGRNVSRVEERKQKNRATNGYGDSIETSPFPEVESESKDEEEGCSPSVNDPSNLWVLCDLCNLSQSKKTFSEFLQSTSLFPLADRKFFIWRYTTLFIHNEQYSLRLLLWVTCKIILYSYRIGRIKPLTFLEFYAQKISENDKDFTDWIAALESQKRLNNGKTKRVVITFDEISDCIRKEKKTNLFAT